MAGAGAPVDFLLSEPACARCDPRVPASLVERATRERSGSSMCGARLRYRVPPACTTRRACLLPPARTPALFLLSADEAADSP
jgi:hypothetical protein